MIKRLFAIFLICLLGVCVVACGDDEEGSDSKRKQIEKEDNSGDEEEEGDTDVNVVPTEDIEPTPTEEVQETPIPTEETVYDPAADGYQQVENVYYLLPEDWKFNSTYGSSSVYVNADQTENLSIAVASLGVFTVDEVVATYQSQIESIYGTNYELSTIDYEFTGEPISGFSSDTMTWYQFSFPTENALNTAIDVDCYLYTDGSLIIYIENGYLDGSQPSGAVDDLIESILIAE